ncbi:hypothetical protein BD560DRAFT_383646 [Blakeslea trispora]|nr:hypothetical protein BD560DRAFT_383646 [Blakeslea trispora]
MHSPLPFFYCIYICAILSFASDYEDCLVLWSKGLYPFHFFVVLFFVVLLFCFFGFLFLLVLELLAFFVGFWVIVF